MISINNDKLEKMLQHKYEVALKNGYKGNFDNFVIGKLYYVANSSYLVDLNKIEKGLQPSTLTTLTESYNKYETLEAALINLINKKDRYIASLINKLKSTPLSKLKKFLNK